MSDIKISQLPEAGPITGAELLPVVQDGVTKSALAGNLKTSITTSNVAFVDVNGDDACGKVGDAVRPFKTAQVAYDKLKVLNGNLELRCGLGSFFITLASGETWKSNVLVTGVSPLVSSIQISEMGDQGVSIPSQRFCSNKTIKMGFHFVAGSGRTYEYSEELYVPGGKGGDVGSMTFECCNIASANFYAGNGGANPYSGQAGMAGTINSQFFNYCEEGMVSLLHGFGHAYNDYDSPSSVSIVFPIYFNHCRDMVMNVTDESRSEAMYIDFNNYDVYMRNSVDCRITVSGGGYVLWGGMGYITNCSNFNISSVSYVYGNLKPIRLKMNNCSGWLNPLQYIWYYSGLEGLMPCEITAVGGSLNLVMPSNNGNLNPDTGRPLLNLSDCRYYLDPAIAEQYAPLIINDYKIDGSLSGAAQSSNTIVPAALVI